jgi:hypothetical protein
MKGAAGGLTVPPVEMLRATGVLVFAGKDDIRDTWSPYGTVDLCPPDIANFGRSPPRRAMCSEHKMTAGTSSQGLT